MVQLSTPPPLPATLTQILPAAPSYGGVIPSGYIFTRALAPVVTSGPAITITTSDAELLLTTGSTSVESWVCRSRFDISIRTSSNVLHYYAKSDVLQSHRNERGTTPAPEDPTWSTLARGVTHRRYVTRLTRNSSLKAFQSRWTKPTPSSFSLCFYLVESSPMVPASFIKQHHGND